MPEGPEIKKAVDFLNTRFEISNKIMSFEFLDGRYLKKKEPDNWSNLSFPLNIDKANCKGKFIYVNTQDPEVSLWITFGLSGYWSITKEKYCKFKVTLENNQKLYYNDKLGYGTLKVCTSKKELDKKLNQLGLDILDKNNTKDNYVKLIRKKSTKSNKEIGLILMDQKLTCGCGNYIRADALYLSKINPFRKINDIMDNELENIWVNLQKVAFFNYNNILGIKHGILEKDELHYLAHAAVYGKSYDIDKNQVETKKLGDRTVHWCPVIQN
jgi:formamidopyrimidine-DNA glycosylase